MANKIEIVIKATDKASVIIDGVESKITGANAAISKSYDDAAKHAQTLDDKLKAFGGNVASLGDKLSIGVTLPLVAAGTAAIKFASDLNETTSKVGVLFGNMADDIKQWSETSATAFGLSRKAALDGASDFAIFGKSAGLAGQGLTEFSKQNVKLASDMASFFNTSPEEAITAIGAAFRGESEPIRRYGVLLNDASLKDEALRQGLIKTTTDALTPQQRILAANALIFQQTSAAQGDFARTSDGVANSTRIAKAQLEDAAATLGTNLLPLVQKGIGFLNGLLEAFRGLSPEMQNVLLASAGIAAAMGPLLSIGGRVVEVVGKLSPLAIDAAHGFGTLAGNAVDVAKYLKDAGVSSESLKFAFDYLKASGAILTAELGLIAAGLVVITKYLSEVEVASRATNDELIKMSHSGDLFKQAAASTEILVNGQNRIRAALDGVNEKLKTSAISYEDYRSSIEATAKAAGYQIDEQGNLITVTEGMAGRVERLVQSNYALSESSYQLAQAQAAATQGAYGLTGALDESNRAAQQSSDALRAGSIAISDTANSITAAQAAIDGAIPRYTSMADIVIRNMEASQAAKKAQDEYNKATADAGLSAATAAQQFSSMTDAQVKQSLAKDTLDTLRKAREEGTITEGQYQKALDATLLRYGLATEKGIALSEAQNEINAAFLNGKIPLDAYIGAAEKLPSVAEDGRVTSEELTQLGVEPLSAAMLTAKGSTQQLVELGLRPYQVQADVATTKTTNLTNALAKLQDKTVTITVNYVTNGTPPNESIGNATTTTTTEEEKNGRALGSTAPEKGGMYFLHPNEWVLSEAQRYGREPIPAQAIPAAQKIGNTRIVNNTNNFYDSISTAMWLEKQRQEELDALGATM